MKKHIILVLVIVLCIVSVVGCKKKEDEPEIPEPDISTEDDLNNQEVVDTEKEENSDDEISTEVLVISNVYDGYFTATPDYPYPAEFKIYYDVESGILNDFEAGNSVEVTLKDLKSTKDESTSVEKYEGKLVTIKAYSRRVDNEIVCYKPVIYLYPEEKTDVFVSLTFPNGGEFTCTYPKYDNGWNVTANPDGTLVDGEGKEYNYLYWEATVNANWDFSEGFCVKGEDSEKFLEEALAKLGLTRKEANEFIVYWLPIMEQNEWNVVSFQTAAYEEAAELTVSPAPESILRVFMAFYSTDEEVEIKEQTLETFERKGFTVVEWGGTYVK